MNNGIIGKAVVYTTSKPSGKGGYTDLDKVGTILDSFNDINYYNGYTYLVETLTGEIEFTTPRRIKRIINTHSKVYLILRDDQMNQQDDILDGPDIAHLIGSSFNIEASSPEEAYQDYLSNYGVTENEMPREIMNIWEIITHPVPEVNTYKWGVKSQKWE